MYLVTSIRPRPSVSVNALTAEPFDLQPPSPVLRICLCVCNQWAFADILADAVTYVSYATAACRLMYKYVTMCVLCSRI